MKRKAAQLDFTILFIVGFFMIVSTFVIYSATTGTKYEGFHLKNLVLYLAFFVPVFLLALFDYRMLVSRLAYVLYGVGVLLLIMVKLFGKDINGSIRWIDLKVIQFQPSELMKIFVILVIARILNNRQGEPLRLLQDILPILGLTFIPLVFILTQPDLGTSIVFIGILIGMLWIGNVRFVHILLGAAAIAVLGALLVGLYYVDFDLFSKIIKPHQLSRIQTFLDPSGDADQGWHVLNSIVAISTGEMYGKGFLQGDYIQQGYIPYDYADSIYVVIGEEFGFLGSAVLLIAYFILIYRMVLIAINSRSLSGSFITVGIVSMFTLQIFENIAMHTGLMPMTGIALPFISYGGSSLLTNMLCIGIVLSIKIHQSAEFPIHASLKEGVR